MSDDFWILIDEAIDQGKDIENLIPRDCVGLSETEYLQILAVYATYGNDPERRKQCKRKLINYETR